MKKVAIVTGTSSGLGKAITQLLAQHGLHIIAGSLTAAHDEVTESVHPVFLDLNNTQSINALVDYALEHFGRIDYLINNAGVAHSGAIESFSQQDAEQLFRVNFFGASELCRLVIPHMRQQGKGKIINISSGAGITAQPFAGYYSASKYALEGFSESLKQELKPFNISVSLVEYNWIKTNIIQHAQTSHTEIHQHYGEAFTNCMSAVEHYCAQGMSAEKAAKTVLTIINTKQPKLRYRVGKDVHSSYWSRKLLPAPLFEYFVKTYYKL